MHLRRDTAHRWFAVLLATLTVFGPLSMDLYLPVLPALAADLGTSAPAAQLTMTACLLGLAFGQVIAGPVSDRLGRRPPLITGLVVYTLASLLCTVSPSIEILVLARLLQGLAGGVGLVIAQSAGRDRYEGAALTRYYGRIVVLSGLAAIVAPVLGGFLASFMGWRGFFVLLSAIGLLVTIAVALGFPETLDPVLRVSGGLRQTWTHLQVFGRDSLFLGVTLVSSLTSAAYFAYLAAAPFVLQEVHGLSPGQFSFVFGLNAAGFAGFGFLAGRAAEKYGEREVFVVGLAIITVGGMLLGTALVSAVSLPVTVAAFFCVAAGAAAVSPPSTTLALVDYPQYAGTASAILGLARFAAGGLAAPLVGLGGSSSMQPAAVVVLSASLLSVVGYVCLVRPSSRSPYGVGVDRGGGPAV
ncbi:Bcr/CflA family drug resistance efflux transporter [Kineosporia sp. NBRC 101677]|uniref:multidrug effflux MFS transporter n=1 Tax=Kineosporia sp. NBRC 101677 TaxID=3032197 RepID=UPI0024A3AC75|nr:multidrug effflux MFS transporter [Kineosporia sp. NBRC 101677]GLY15248.1 Bcr/CflA family drug resistance efflux transporter [Kineosporia sp. NBRC 101677]